MFFSFFSNNNHITSLPSHQVEKHPEWGIVNTKTVRAIKILLADEAGAAAAVGGGAAAGADCGREPWERYLVQQGDILHIPRWDGDALGDSQPLTAEEAAADKSHMFPNASAEQQEMVRVWGLWQYDKSLEQLDSDLGKDARAWQAAGLQFDPWYRDWMWTDQCQNAEAGDDHGKAIDYLHEHRKDADVARLLKRIGAKQAVGSPQELHRFVGLETLLNRLAKMHEATDNNLALLFGSVMQVRGLMMRVGKEIATPVEKKSREAIRQHLFRVMGGPALQRAALEQMTDQQFEAQNYVEDLTEPLMMKPATCDSRKCSKQSSKENKFKLCQGCKAVRYCSVKCQEEQWTLHKTACLQDVKQRHLDAAAALQDAEAAEARAGYEKAQAEHDAQYALDCAKFEKQAAAEMDTFSAVGDGSVSGWTQIGDQGTFQERAGKKFSAELPPSAVRHVITTAAARAGLALVEQRIKYMEELVPHYDGLSMRDISRAPSLDGPYVDGRGHLLRNAENGALVLVMHTRLWNQPDIMLNECEQKEGTFCVGHRIDCILVIEGVECDGGSSTGGNIIWHPVPRPKDDLSEVSPVLLGASSNEADECAICLDTLGDCAAADKVVITECQHFFHADCIAEWRASNDSCPVCRNRFYIDSLQAWLQAAKVAATFCSELGGCDEFPEYDICFTAQEDSAASGGGGGAAGPVDQEAPVASVGVVERYVDADA